MVCKRCYFWRCNSDNRYMHKPHMEGVEFIKFPHPVKSSREYRLWMSLCGREVELGEEYDQDKSKQYKAWRNGSRYICSKHWEGGNGPSVPDEPPIGSTVQGYKLRKPIEVIYGLQTNAAALPTRMTELITTTPDKTNSNCIQKNNTAGLKQPVLVFIKQNSDKPINKVQDKSMPIMKDKPFPPISGNKVELSESILRKNNENLTNNGVTLAAIDDTVLPSRNGSAKSYCRTNKPAGNVTEVSNNSFNFSKLIQQTLAEPGWFLTSKSEEKITYSRINNNSLVICVTVGKDLNTSVSVYGQELDPKHKIYDCSWSKIESMTHLKNFLRKLTIQWHLCVGNFEEGILPLKDKLSNGGYYEPMSKAIHSIKCSKLTATLRARCLNCQKYRSCLRKKISILRIQQGMKAKNKAAHRRMAKLKKKEALKFPKIRGEVKQTFGAKFIEEQIKMLNASSKFGRRWSLDVINWCATMEAAFPKAYQFLKVSGALKLPDKNTILKSLHQQFGNSAPQGAKLAKTVLEEIEEMEAEEVESDELEQGNSLEESQECTGTNVEMGCT